MTAITVYQTPKTLTFAYTKGIKQLSIKSIRAFKLEERMDKAILRTSVKFSVHNELLYVSYARGMGKEMAVTSRIAPNLAGLLATFIHPKTVDAITAFLDTHFPDAEVSPLNEMEKMFLEELRFFDSNISGENQIKIANLVLRIVKHSFPIYSSFITNRLADGFYSDGYSDGLKKYHRAKTYREFIVSLFGVYRKDLAKAVAGSRSSTIVWASNFKNLLNIEVLIEAIRTLGAMPTENSFSFEALAGFPESTLKKLLADGPNNYADPITVDDALEMCKFVPLGERKNISTWNELHDFGMANYRLDADGDEKISHPKEFEAFFEEAKFGGLTINPLRDAKSFVATGQQMSVCVGSLPYIMRAFNGEGYCFRLDGTDDCPYALVEVKRVSDSSSWRLSQVRGISNAELPNEFSDKLSKELSKYITMESRT